MSPTRSALLSIVLLPLLGSCMVRMQETLMEEAPSASLADFAESVEVLGEVGGDAEYDTVFLLFGRVSPDAPSGKLLVGDGKRPLFERDTWEIPLVTPAVRAVGSILTGSLQLQRTRDIALGVAMQRARELGADYLMAPQFDIEYGFPVFFVPLGPLFGEGKVRVRAKAVRYTGLREAEELPAGVVPVDTADDADAMPVSEGESASRDG